MDFSTQIKPLLESRCIECHNSGALFGELNLENHDMAFKSRSKGPVITPGQPEKSPLYIVLTLPVSDMKSMPPIGHKIPDAEVDLVKRWIKEGAKWPEGAEGVVKAKLVNKVPSGA